MPGATLAEPRERAEDRSGAEGGSAGGRRVPAGVHVAGIAPPPLRTRQRYGSV
jgi:hypothetical protein